MKIIVAGTKTFDDYVFLKQKLEYLFHNITEEIIIISGKAEGADTLGEQYAKEKGYTVLPFPADWDNLDVVPCFIKTNRKGKKYNALAGFNRNEEMAKNADALVAFWDGKSHGTKDMITRAKKYGLKTKVVIYGN